MTNLNPFPGLRSFDYEESHLFFGREKHISDLLRKLSNNHFVAIVGTSGSGKSSLVRAGLLPAIHQGKLSTDGSEWLITTLKPGNSAVHNLAESLVNKNTFSTGDPASDAELTQTVENQLRASRLGLVQAVRGLLPPKKNLLLLLDQFEETFRFSEEGTDHNDEDSTQFVNLIIDAVRQRDVPIYVVLTIRSDFLGDCARFEGLPEAINDGHYLVPRLTAEQNKAVITGPVNYAHGKISPRLVQRVINDLGDNPDQLPVLQHALMRTWDVWKAVAETGEPMDLRHYELIGGMENALSRHADEAFLELTPAQQTLAERIFKCLTVKTGDRGVRRPASVAQLMDITGAGFKEVEQALLPFRIAGRTFILPSADTAINPHTVIDISHESLMRAWNRLTEWVDEEAESANIYKRLCESTFLHHEGKAALWRNPELQMALDWKEKEKPSEAWARQYNNGFVDAMNFLDDSHGEHLATIQKQNRRKRTIRTAVATFLAVVTVLTAWALLQTKEARKQSDLATRNQADAEKQAKEAINQKQLAEKAREIALDASKKALDAKSYAELQSRIAVEQKQLAEEQRQKAEQEAIRASMQERLALEQKKIADLKSAEALREKRKADSAYIEKERLRRISLSQNIAFRSIQEKGDPQLAGLLAMQAFNLSQKNGGNMNDAQIYSAMFNAAQKLDPAFNNAHIRETENILAADLINQSFYTYLLSNQVKNYQAENPGSFWQQKLHTLPGAYNTSFFSSGGEYLAIGLENNNIAIFHQRFTEKPQILQGHTGLVRAVAFNTGATQMISGGRDSNLIIWNNFKITSRIKLASRVKAIAYSTGGNAFAACEDGQIFRINTESGDHQLFAAGSGRLQTMDVSGKTLAAGFANGAVWVYNMSGQTIRNINEPAAVEFLRLDESADLLVTALSNKSLRMYRLSETAKPIEINTGRFISSLNLDKTFVYISSENTINRYPISTGWFEAILSSGLKRKLTTEEWNLYIGSDIPTE